MQNYQWWNTLWFTPWPRKHVILWIVLIWTRTCVTVHLTALLCQHSATSLSAPPCFEWGWGGGECVLLSHFSSGQRACVGCNISAAKVKKNKTLWQILPESQAVMKGLVLLPAHLGFWEIHPCWYWYIEPFPEYSPSGWNFGAGKETGMTNGERVSKGPRGCKCSLPGWLKSG